MTAKKAKTKEDYAASVAERAERARVEMELLQLDLSNELEALVAVEKKIASAQAAERKAKATITDATAERNSIRASIRSAVEPYVNAGASIDVAAAVTGMSSAALRNRNTDSTAEPNYGRVDNLDNTAHNEHPIEDEYDVER